MTTVEEPKHDYERLIHIIEDSDSTSVGQIFRLCLLIVMFALNNIKSAEVSHNCDSVLHVTTARQCENICVGLGYG